MDIYILDHALDMVPVVIDSYESFIWTERYDRCGDFEIFTQNVQTYLDNCKQGYYIRIVGSDTYMIIEDIDQQFNYEEGNSISITGRSIESILDRRHIWQQTLLDGSLQDEIERLLNENIINPTNPDRKISNFKFQKSTDPLITELTIKSQFTGTNIYNLIVAICEAEGIGFKITINNQKEFVFQLYAGIDRSFKQSVNPYVIFSPEFDNIVNGSFYQSDAILKTVTLVAGEGEGLERKTLEVFSDENKKGLERREMYTDARDVQSVVRDEEGEEKILTIEEYNELLTARGKQELAEAIFIEALDGEAEESVLFKYGQDYFLGDIIQVLNEYKMETRSRIVEVIRSDDESGSYVYPTFMSVNREVVL